MSKKPITREEVENNIAKTIMERKQAKLKKYKELHKGAHPCINCITRLSCNNRMHIDLLGECVLLQGYEVYLELEEGLDSLEIYKKMGEY